MHTTSRNRPLIGLAAKAQSGKTTVANMLLSSYGYGHVSFAEPIRQFIADLTGITREDLEKAEIKEAVIPWIGRSPRYMMQTLGTEWGRDTILADFWIKRAMRHVNDLSWGRIPAVISDVRFDNEAKAIREAGGYIVHLVRPDALVVASHASEAGVRRESSDYAIVNDGSLADLERKVDELMSELLSR